MSGSWGRGRHERVLIYTGDNLGLGHLRRCLHIATRLVREQQADVVLLTGLPLGSPFEVPDGVDVIKLPSLLRDTRGRYEPRTLSGEGSELARLRSEMMRAVVRELRPRLLLVDHTPLGVAGDLRAVIDDLEPHTRLVLGLRDIVGAPDTIRGQWRRRRVSQVLSERYDEVLIYGSRDVFDAAAHYGLDAVSGVPVRYCGYVGSETAAGWKRSDADATRRALVTVGGGADGYATARACLDALRLVARDATVATTLITGPFMPRAEREDLDERARELSARVLSRTEQLPRLMADADVLMTMAGYNTLVESHRAGKRPIVIPRRGPSREQRIRAELFAARGLVLAADPDAAPRTIARLVERALEQGEPAGTRLDTDGLSRVVGHLGRLIEDGLETRAVSSVTPIRTAARRVNR